MAAESETLPAFEEAARSESQNGAAAKGDANGAAPEKKRKGRPKDLNAPKRPPTPMAQVTGPARERLRVERPELMKDLGKMMTACREVWEQVPQEQKDEMQEKYEAEMEIWKPKWEEYKKTDSYKEFCLEKQEYKDKREKRKFLKAEAKKAPKRPKSGWGIFGDEVRARVKEAVMAEGGGMGDIGKKIAEEWSALSETKKAEYQEMAQAQKEKFQVAFADYKKTQDFKDFQLNKAKMDGKHQLNALHRSTHRDAPAKPPGSFSLWKRSVLKQVMEEQKGKGTKASELSKVMGEKWKNMSAEEREPFVKEAAELKATYNQQVEDFKRKQIYLKFLQKRVVVKSKENRQVNLQDMPKKPKNVYALFRDDIKTEVPSGKGEGKGMNFVKNKFQEMDDAKKLEYKQKEAELKEKYDEELKSYKEGETYKTFQKTSGKIKKEMLTEAMKVMTLKFLKDAPREPPKTAFSLYLGEKRRAEESGAPKKKSRKESQDEVAAYKLEWSKLDKDAQKIYEEKRKEKVNVWTDEVKAYMELPKWKEYIEEAKMLKVPVKSLLHSKKRVIKKLKNGMKLQPLPERPESMPTKPPKARRIFFLEKRNEVTEPAKIQEMWDSLSEEVRSEYAAKEAEQAKDYQEALSAFRESEEGKQYVRKVHAIQKSRATAIAKDKFLVGMPKKPLGLLQLYAREKAKELKKEKPDLKGADLRAEITNSWKALDDEGRKVYEDKGMELYDDYKAKLEEFQQTEEYKKYKSTMKRIQKPKPKAKASNAGPQKPSTMPAKPPDAFKLYKAQADSGKKATELFKEFQELASDEKEKLRQEAIEAQKDFQEKMKEWRTTDEGKKYVKESNAFERKRRVANARQKFLKDQPKRPPNPMFLFCQDKRAEYAPQFPELKGVRINGKLAEIFRGLSEEEKKVYEDRAKVMKDEYNEKLEEFHKSSDFKKYTAALKPRASGKAKAKVKKDKGPEIPDSMPKRPPKGITLFARATPGLGGLAGQAKAWKELDAEEQQKYNEQAEAKRKEYEEEMESFRKTAEGKRYFRLKKAAEKKTRIEAAKKKYLGAEDGPKPPKPAPSSYQFFVQEKKPPLLAAGKPIREVATELTAMWGNLSEEDRKPYEDQAAEAKEKYDEELAEYKKSDGFKKFERYKASQNKTKSKTKAKPAKEKAKAKGRAKAKAKGRTKAVAEEDSDSSDVMGSDSSSSSSSSD